MATTPENITSCIRCGTCCTKGGPVLHAVDKHIIMAGQIRTEHLITIRKGELAQTPDDEGLHPVQHELVKIAGRGGSWECLFFDKSGSACTIYEQRPLECRILKCWDTTDLLSVVGKDPLQRADIVDPEDPISKLIEIHEKRCAVQRMEEILSSLSKTEESYAPLKELEELVQEDLAFCDAAVSEFGLPLPVELFMLGSPLFKLLGGRGIAIGEEDGRLRLCLSS